MTDTDIPRGAPIGSPRPLLRMKRRPMVIGAIVLLVLAGGGAGLHWWTVGRFQVSTDNAYVRADIVTVNPRIAGYITTVRVRDNQHVAEGEILATLDDRDYRSRLLQAEGAVAVATAQVRAQQAAIANLDAQSTRQQSVIAAAAADLRAHQADLRQAAQAYRRERLLADQQASDAKHLEAADASAQRTAANADAARAAVAASTAYTRVLVTERERASAALDQAQGALVQAQAGLALATLDLEHTVIRAPQAGTVGQRSLRMGDYVGAGAPLMAIVPDQIYIVANYKEVQLERVEPGQPVEIEVDALGGRALKGRVESFAPASGAQFALLPPDNATGNFTKIVQRMSVRITVDAGQAKLSFLRPGMSVVAAIDTRTDRAP